ncbi:MAG: hypothetical protein HY074_08885 [Deltaproteobacteria bacterium]|nr:hypothetical protein [Deltaproteobacteria bacterium]
MKTWTYSWIIYPLLYSLAAMLGMAKPKWRDTLRLRSWKDFLSLRFNVGQPIEYWIHVASHGELEYAIPILEELQRKEKRILVTYYSISAKGPVEQLPQNFANVSLVVPLPHDGLGLMKEFVSLARRQGVNRLLLMKYELWPGLLWECNAQGIKVVLVDALKPSWFHRQLLHKLDGILSGYGSEVSTISHRNVRVVGDTRVERVLQRVERSEKRLTTVVPGQLRIGLAQKPTIICGSMWPADSKLVLAGLKKYFDAGGDCHVIWVPHELEASEAARVSERFAAMGFLVIPIDECEQRLGKKSAEELANQRLAIVVMKKGILAELYRLGQAAFVGGGFGSGVHSVWEPALTGAQVACGPRTRRSPESSELGSRGILARVENEEQLCDWLGANLNLKKNELRDDGPLGELLGQHVGAAKRIVQVCEEL